MYERLTPEKVYEMYKRWVINNPNLVTDVETVATWSSYFVAGKINKSPIVSELVYSMSKLLSLLNDRLIKEAYGHDVQYYGLRDQIKLWLTVIHYCEVFVELVVKQKCGDRGKWTVASLLQLFKCSSALILLYKYKELPIQHPPIASLQRKKFTEDKILDDNANSFFKLKRSGRVVRCVDGSPPVPFRDWQPIRPKDDRSNSITDINDLMMAETLHIIKPMIHLAAMKCFGPRAWKQWLVALGIDLASMKLYNRHLNNLNYDQRIEISRRKLGLVLYLLRSPMYNGYSKNVIQNVLTSLSTKIPLASLVCRPLIQYLNHWQEVYFYMWSS